MAIPLKTRQNMADEFNMNIQMFMRLIKSLNIQLPERRLLLPPHQKWVYEAIYYPDCVDRALYEKF